MKKVLLFLSSLLLLMASCSNDEFNEGKASEEVKNQSDKIRWYGTKLPDTKQTKGVADGSKRWNQDSGIFIKFLNTPADPQLIDQIKQIAAEWEEYAGIKFHFVEQDKNANVRIAFDWNDNDWLTWSYTGTDAKYVRNQQEPTAVFGGIEYLDEEELKGDVLRLFGQVLGLEYEQRHQEWAANGYWKDVKYLQSYWEDQFEGFTMDWDEIREYVFDPLTDENAFHLLQTREIDELSVMAWPYYSRKQTTNILANYELSDGDKEFIALLYPPVETLPTIQEAWVDAGYFVWTDETKTALRITRLGAEQEYLPDVCDGEQLTSANKMFFFREQWPQKYPIIKKAPKFNTENITDFERMFDYCLLMTEIPHYKTSKGINFMGMFSDCPSLVNIPLLDTSNGTSFANMFYQCRSLVTIPHFNTSKGTDFSYMFIRCRSLTSIPHLDTSNGTNFRGMFITCDSLISIPHLDTAKGVYFSSMFSQCISLTSIPHFITSMGIDFGGMLEQCNSLTNVPLFDTTKGTNFYGMFMSCISLTEIPHLETSKGDNFQGMFWGCSSLTSIPHLNTSNGTDFSSMFTSCHSLTDLPLLDTSKGTNFKNMFQNASALISIPKFDTSNGTIFSSMFYKCTSLTNIPDINTSNGINFDYMFFSCRYLTGIPHINTSKGTNFNYMFYDCQSLTDKPQLDLSNALYTNNMYYGTPFQ